MTLSVITITDNKQLAGYVIVRFLGAGALTVKRSALLDLKRAVSDYLSALPPNMRAGNTCPDCDPPRLIDDRAKHCRNHRKRRGREIAE
jgi:hypothetical protein